jgi:arylamine N-acetyltransferase
LNLADSNLAIHGAGTTEKIQLDGAAAVLDTLRDRFGINIDDIGERSMLEARIEKILEN